MRRGEFCFWSMNNATLFHSFNLEAKLKELKNFKPYFSDFTLVASINHKKNLIYLIPFPNRPGKRAEPTKWEIEKRGFDRSWERGF